MTTLAFDATGAGRPPMKRQGTQVGLQVTGQFSFDSSYPTGGEDISDIFNQFKELHGIWFDPSVPLTSAGTGKRMQVDYTNKKLLLFDNAVSTAQVANASDQSGSAAIRFCAWGV